MSDPARTLEGMLQALQSLPQRLAAALSSVAGGPQSPAPQAPTPATPQAPQAASTQPGPQSQPGQAPPGLSGGHKYNNWLGVSPFSVAKPPDGRHDVYGAMQDHLGATAPFLPGGIGRMFGKISDLMGKARHYQNTKQNLADHWARATRPKRPVTQGKDFASLAGARKNWSTPLIRGPGQAAAAKAAAQAARANKAAGMPAGPQRMAARSPGWAAMSAPGPGKQTSPKGPVLMGARKPKPATARSPGRAAMSAPGPGKQTSPKGPALVGSPNRCPGGQAESEATSGKDTHLEDNTEALEKLGLLVEKLDETLEEFAEALVKSGKGGGAKASSSQGGGGGEGDGPKGEAGKATDSNLAGSVLKALLA